MKKILKDKVAVVTGSGRGLGREIVMGLAAYGAKVVVNDLGGALDGTGKDVQVSALVADEIKKKGGEAVANSDNIATMEGAENLINTAVKSFGKIDILVNCAGILRDRMIWNMSEAEWDDVIKVHLKGHFACCKAAIIKMKEQKSGRIINITSIAGTDGSIGQPNYSAAKSGIIGLTRSLALALPKYNITVNCISPAAATRMTASMPEEQLRMGAQAMGMQITEKTTLDEMQKYLLGDPAAIPPVVVYLASDEAASLNGNIFQVRGGNIGSYAPLQIYRSMAKKGGIWTVEELVEKMPGLVDEMPFAAGLLGLSI